MKKSMMMFSYKVGKNNLVYSYVNGVYIFLFSIFMLGYGYTEDDFLLGGVEKSNSSEISSGYSTISNDNLPSPALYLPPPAGDGGYAELEQREGGISGWDNWRIAENEVTLGNIVSSTELETIYR